MRESELHRRIFARSADLSGTFPSVVVGPGDDCAVVRTVSGDHLLLKVDQVVEGRHFRAGAATTIDQIARKAIARAVSDIAAMGGTLTGGWSLASGVLPPGYPHADELCERLAHWARHWGAPLVGGDIASGPPGCPLCLSISLIGQPHATRGPVLRSTAQPGDDVWVTGTIGSSLAHDGGGKHLNFEPRLKEARWLCDTLGPDLHAMMDISDGLGRDAGRIAAASGVRIEIDGTRVPLSHGVQDVLTAAGDGEDYELLFCITSGRSLNPSSGLPPMTKIGRVAQGSGCGLVLGTGEVREAETLGWDH
jgi:thiamine-monophosphate kinase